ncbi:unnamed protein product [Ilex paraguariensis]|uniref:Uncharacterized protein n=1 Tax=Ilex paraguariensis TaxID=185542 RepID=A0ABC8T2D1_9AQUA
MANTAKRKVNTCPPSLTYVLFTETGKLGFIVRENLVVEVQIHVISDVKEFSSKMSDA